MLEVRQPGQVGDPPVPDGGQVVDDGEHRLAVVGPDPQRPGALARSAEHDGGQAERVQDGEPGVAQLEVDHDEAVDPVLGGPAAVDLDLGRGVLDHHQLQGDGVRGQHRLEAGQQLAEERLDADGPGRAGDHQSDRVRPGPAEGAGGAVRPPVHLLRDLEDPGPGRLAHPRAAVEREGHRALGDSRPTGDVGDGRSAHGFRLLS